MSSLKLLRQQLGFTLAEFAELLNCSNSTLSMAESGLRQLPPAALQAFTAIESALPGAAAIKLPPYHQKDNKMLQTQLKNQQRLLKNARLKMEALTETLEQLEFSLKLFTCFEQKPFLSDEVAQMRMKIAMRKTQKNYQECCTEWWKLQSEIAGLEAQQIMLTQPQNTDDQIGK